MKRLEAFADSIANYYDYNSPESDAYELRNPGMLAAEAAHPQKDGKRLFSCHKAGYSALLDHTKKYCTEHPFEKLRAGLPHFGIKMLHQQEKALDFMARCINSNALTLETSLKWFIEE